MKTILIYILLLFSINSFALESNDVLSNRDDEFDLKLDEFSKDYFALNNFKSGLLRILDKITTRVSNLKIDIGSSVKFGTLEINIQKCLFYNQEDQKNPMALLQIKELLQDGTKEERFYGWVFADSISLSALEHPVYDISLIKCE